MALVLSKSYRERAERPLASYKQSSCSEVRTRTARVRFGGKMSDSWQYWDTYYKSSYPDGENVDAGASHFNFNNYVRVQGQGYIADYRPSEFGYATATSSSAAVVSVPNALISNRNG